MDIIEANASFHSIPPHTYLYFPCLFILLAAVVLEVT
jgi:hypothetical protein